MPPDEGGQVAEVKAKRLAKIDDGETDWKVFCIRTDDPLAGAIHDVDDLERGAVSTMREWFREYKVAEGKPLNASRSASGAWTARTPRRSSRRRTSWKRRRKSSGTAAPNDRRAKTDEKSAIQTHASQKETRATDAGDARARGVVMHHL